MLYSADVILLRKDTHSLMKPVVVTIAVGVHIVLAAFLLNLSVWFHFLYCTDDPRLVEAFDQGQATFGVVGYTESVGLMELFSDSNPHTWLIALFSLAMVAVVIWTVVSVVGKITKR